MNTENFVPYQPLLLSDAERLEAAHGIYEKLNARRSLRMFSDEPVDREVIENIILSAGTAPSGANKQPWTFCAVNDPELKKKIREAAEIEEYENYHGRMSQSWLKDLDVFDTDWHKPFLETAPWLIVVFKKAYDLDELGQQHKNYYVNESVGIACVMLLTAIHFCGLVALTHTPSPMNFLSSLLERPENERPFLLIPVGKPAVDSRVLDITRKSLNEISQFYTTEKG